MGSATPTLHSVYVITLTARRSSAPHVSNCDCHPSIWKKIFDTLLAAQCQGPTDQGRESVESSETSAAFHTPPKLQVEAGEPLI